MFEPTLANLGKYLAEKSGLSLANKQIGYVERELMFNYLSNESMPLTLPAIAFSIGDISDPQELRPLHNSKGEYALNLNKVTVYDLIPLNMSVNIGLIADNLNDYFFLIKFYYLTVKERQFVVSAKSSAGSTENDEPTEVKFNCTLNNHSGLSTPPGGKEGRDYDRGKYYLLEGSFEINTFAIFSEDHVVIRSGHLISDWGEIQVIGG